MRGIVVSFTPGRAARVLLSADNRAPNNRGRAAGGDQYVGLDMFGRVVDQRWTDDTGSTTTDRFQYAYDQDSDVLYKDNILSSENSELYHVSGASYGYDGLARLTDFERGELSDTNDDDVLDTSTDLDDKSWDLDALGNTAAHNQQNQLDSLDYDANGSTLDDGTNTYTYDAWNRIATTTVDGHTYEYAYDAMDRRTVEGSSPGGVFPVPPNTHLYYDDAWQVIQEDTEGDGESYGSTRVQNVWSPAYIDALVLRDTTYIEPVGGDSRGEEEIDPGVERPVPAISERLYAQQDAGWNTTAVTDEAGAVQQRFIYDPYGAVAYLDDTWSPGSDDHVFTELYRAAGRTR